MQGSLRRTGCTAAGPLTSRGALSLCTHSSGKVEGGRWRRVWVEEADLVVTEQDRAIQLSVA